MSISGKNLGFVIDDYGNTGGVGTTRVLTKKDEQKWLKKERETLSQHYHF